MGCNGRFEKFEKPWILFLGSVVLIKEELKPKALVVDGQQRLTTLTMLMAVLLHLWRQENYESGVKSITPFLYKEGDEMLGKERGYRLIVRDEDKDFFRKNIQEPNGIAQLICNTEKLKDSCLRYRENVQLLLEKTKALPSEKRKDLWRFLANDCSLVVISTPDLESAYRIFSVLNDRGLELSPIDLLKAWILGEIRDKEGKTQSRNYATK